MESVSIECRIDKGNARCPAKPAPVGGWYVDGCFIGSASVNRRR